MWPRRFNTSLGAAPAAGAAGEGDDAREKVSTCPLVIAGGAGRLGGNGRAEDDRDATSCLLLGDRPELGPRLVSGHWYARRAENIVKEDVMKVETKVNGVAVDKLMETMDLLRAQPALAAFKFRTQNTWVDGTLNRAENPPFYGAGAEDTGRTEPHRHEIDEPPVLLGEDRGANPVEYLLTGLSGCVTTTFIAYAAAQGVKIDELRTELEGDLDVRGFLGLSGQVRPGFQEIRVTFHVKSDAPREKIEELVKLAERRSPVSDSVRKGVPVRFDVLT